MTKPSYPVEERRPVLLCWIKSIQYFSFRNLCKKKKKRVHGSVSYRKSSRCWKLPDHHTATTMHDTSEERTHWKKSDRWRWVAGMVGHTHRVQRLLRSIPDPEPLASCLPPSVASLSFLFDYRSIKFKKTAAEACLYVCVCVCVRFVRVSGWETGVCVASVRPFPMMLCRGPFSSGVQFEQTGNPPSPESIRLIPAASSGI